MKKFLVLYSSSVNAAENMAKATPEQQKQVMDAWMAWGAKAATAIVDFGLPAGNPNKIDARGATPSESKVGGFSILQAESAQALGELLKEHPHFKAAPGAGIEILELFPVPGM